MLESLDQWRLRVAWLDLQLLCQQLTTTSAGVAAGEMNLLLDTVARAVLDVFELTTNQSVCFLIKKKTKMIPFIIAVTNLAIIITNMILTIMKEFFWNQEKLNNNNTW